MKLEWLIESAEKELERLDKQRRELLSELSRLRREKENRESFGEQAGKELPKPVSNVSKAVHGGSPAAAKITLFRSLFRGREDVFPRRFESKRSGRSGYQPACRNEWMRGVCRKPAIKCANCDHREFIPVSDKVIKNHLIGYDPAERNRHEYVIGDYPLLLDNTCRFLATDFDKTTWQEDATAFLQKCHFLNIPAILERSRSGNGGHVWIFFAESVPAAMARRMGSYVVTEAMEEHPEMGFESYDRFFPNQDIVPSEKGGFGNLIALPFQRKPSEQGNSLFVDETFTPYGDQWGFLSSIRRMQKDEVEAIADEAARKGKIIGVRMAVTDEDEDRPWTAPPSRRIKDTPIMGTVPPHVGLVLSDQIYIPKENLPPQLRNRLIRTAAFQNPEFYKAQAMRRSTFGKPRIIACCEDHIKYLSLPRGCAAYIIAKRRINTLVLVNRKQLLEQWLERLHAFLEPPKGTIGQIGAGKRKPSGVIDVALLQSLCRNGNVDDSIENYGQMIVDECHHITAPTFELAARRCKARHFLGLSATVTRKDGQHPIIFMQLGPLRYLVTDKEQALKRPFDHETVVRVTDFSVPKEDGENVTIQEIYGLLCSDAKRNALKAGDVCHALELGRSPVILTERREHVERLAALLAEHADEVLVLQGGLGKKKTRNVLHKLANRSDRQRLVLVATGRFIGEGFDDARLDTLFLALPVSWRGTLAQYAGRLHRLHHAKQKVIVHDYADLNVPVLAKMFERRKVGYKAIGYDVKMPAEPFTIGNRQ